MNSTPSIAVNKHSEGRNIDSFSFTRFADIECLRLALLFQMACSIRNFHSVGAERRWAIANFATKKHSTLTSCNWNLEEANLIALPRGP